MIRPISRLAAATLLAATSAASAQAQSRTWDLGGTWNTGSTLPSGGCAITTGTSTSQANVVSCASTGTASTLQLRAFANSTTTGAVTTGNVRTHGSYGVGICNVWEASNCTAPNHAIDDVTPGADFLLLSFDRSVALNGLTFGWTGASATGVQVYRWNGAADPLGTLTAANQNVANLVGSTGNTFSLVSGFTLSGFATPSNLLTNSSFNAGSLTSQYWVVAPDGGNHTADAFKLRSVRATTPVPVNASVVPEPSTYALMGTGLAALLGVARRRRAA